MRDRGSGGEGDGEYIKSYKLQAVPNKVLFVDEPDSKQVTT